MQVVNRGLEGRVTFLAARKLSGNECGEHYWMCEAFKGIVP